jgi:hypothetical protein
MTFASSGLIATAGIISAFLAIGVAVHYFRRTSSLYALLIEGANRYEELRAELARLEKARQSADAAALSAAERELTLDKELGKTRDQAATALQLAEAKDHEVRYVREKLELQKNHLIKQLEQTETRSEDLNAKLQDITEKYEALSSRRDESKQKELSELRQELRQTREKLVTSEKHAADLERRVKDVDPVEFRQLKRRLLQYDRLYTSMRGLRDMADERNRNWETALRKLATWTLQNHRPGASARPVPESIGPLVGQALEVIGATLVDEFDDSKPAEASAEDLSGMDGVPDLNRAAQENSGTTGVV